jgi:Protein of unknown function (DUF1360)
VSVEDDVVDLLAVARITRLIVTDRVPFGPLRERIRRRAFEAQDPTGPGDEDPYLVELLECPWCASVWVALAVLFLRRLPGWRLVARVLAASQVAGMMASWVERE